MKKITILASALLFTGVAYAQGPTNSYQGMTYRPMNTPTNANTANQPVSGASMGGFSGDYHDYSQDSYINQAGNSNDATVTQTDGRSSALNGGGTAFVYQPGSNNIANQTQTLVGNSNFSNSGNNPESRNYVGTTQAGTASQSDQTQTSGGYNKLVVNQGALTTGNRAIQTQSIDANGAGAGNQGTISQTKYSTFTNSGSYNRAEQDQSGYNQKALVSQESSNSYAYQKQRDGGVAVSDGNSAEIHQGAPGDANTAVQDQSGVRNNARIQQGVYSGSVPPSANSNFARQTQSNQDNQADIFQGSSHNYAEQLQSGAHNFSSMDQRNVSSAAYSTQSGNNNTAIVTQH